MNLWEVIGAEAAAESALWAESLRPSHERELVAVFSPLGADRFALALETIYEAYLVHYGRPRLFAPADADTGLLLGDYLYAHGLSRIAAAGDVGAVADLAELVSLCAHLRAENAGGDGEAWAATAATLGDGVVTEARDALLLHRDPEPLRRLAADVAGAAAVDRALALHRRRVG